MTQRIAYSLLQAWYCVIEGGIFILLNTRRRQRPETRLSAEEAEAVERLLGKSEG